MIPVGGVSQKLLLIEKNAKGVVQHREIVSVKFVPMTGEAERAKRRAPTASPRRSPHGGDWRPGTMKSAPSPTACPPPVASPRPELTLFDSTCIIVGIIIGAGIYRSSPDVAGLAPSATWLIGLWLLGGALCLAGVLCYAELATAYPDEGGDYVYLTRALGRRIGFLFAWCQLWIVRPGSIGAMAYAFAEYANRIWPRADGGYGTCVLVTYAVGAIVVLTVVNVLGVREGKWTQNVLTTAKVLGLAAIVATGFLYAAPAAAAARRRPAPRPAFRWLTSAWR